MLQSERTVHTTCPYCGVGCQMDLHLQVNYGNLCVKGRFGYDYIYARDRLQTPLLRTDRTTPFQSERWEQALSFVAQRISALRDAHGPDSIAFLTSAKCTNEENYLVQKLARGVIGTNNVDHCARL
jgi:predicted molibdopterin-dependent oxidoreductase YjgC